MSEGSARSPSGRGQRLLADGIAALSAILLVASATAIQVAEPGNLVVNFVESGVLPFVLGFGGVGWLLARRLPGNPIGWSFSVGGLLWAVGAVDGVWVGLALAGHVELGALARACATLNGFSWIFAMPFSIQLPLLLLPNGRLLSRRWRPVAWMVVAGVVVGTVGFATIPGPIEGTDPSRHLVNPMGVRVLGPLPQILALTGAGMLLFGLTAGAVAVVLRFRRSRGAERQQVRWVALGGCCILVAPLTGLVPGVPEIFGGLAGTASIVAVPVCVGVAVLRYRLYDLGRVVSRTVSYAVLTTLLLGVYVVLVTTSAQLLPNNSSLAVAASTLAAAALFQPLRRRVQTLMDRRFNRARYDANRTVAVFTGRLREEVDLDTVRTDLLNVVQATMQPASAGLWLRNPDRISP